MRHPRTAIALLAAMFGLATVAINTSADSAAAAPNCAALNRPAHERINWSTRATLITQWPSEAANARNKYRFHWNRGTPFEVSPSAASGLVGIHRMYNPGNHDFRYVWSSAEISSLKTAGYRDGGIVFYASNAAASCVTPVYRYSRQGVTQYASTAARRKALEANNWTYQKIAFYAAPISTSGSADVSGGPLGRPLYVYKSGHAWKAYQRATNPKTKRLIYQIAGTSSAIWLGGSSTDGAGVKGIVSHANQQRQTPVFVLYAIPYRDCGRYWDGGLSGVSAYKRWIDSIRAGIAKRPAVVIVEPDAIGLHCLPKDKQAERITMLRYAMQTLSQDRNTWVYIHGGSRGLDTEVFAPILKQAGVQYGRGIAVNISGYDTTAGEMEFGEQMLRDLAKNGVPGKRYVIDTSRNGMGRGKGAAAAHGACNQLGRALGKRPTTSTGARNVDAWLWIKPPGESDGACFRGDPHSGWFQSYALDITERAIQRGIITPKPLP